MSLKRIFTAIFIIGSFCSNTQVLASADLYALGEDSSGAVQLVNLDSSLPSGASAVGATGVDGLAFLEYDPRSDWFVSKDASQVHHIDRSTGASTPFPLSTAFEIQGMAYVTSLNQMLVAINTSPPGPEQQIGRLNSDGSITPIFNLSSSIADIDEMFWDPVQMKLYASDVQASEIYEIDEVSGLLANTISVATGENFRASINPLDGLIYEVATPDTTILLTRNPSTGSQIATIGTIAGVSAVRGLSFVPEPTAGLLLGAGCLAIGFRRRRSS